MSRNPISGWRLRGVRETWARMPSSSGSLEELPDAFEGTKIIPGIEIG